jgi:hypothetical protein
VTKGVVVNPKQWAMKLRRLVSEERGSIESVELLSVEVLTHLPLYSCCGSLSTEAKPEWIVLTVPANHRASLKLIDYPLRKDLSSQNQSPPNGQPIDSKDLS